MQEKKKVLNYIQNHWMLKEMSDQMTATMELKEEIKMQQILLLKIIL